MTDKNKTADVSKTVAIHCHTVLYENYPDHKDPHGADSIQMIYDAARSLSALDPNKYPKFDFIAAGPHLHKPWHGDKTTGDIPDNKFYGVVTTDTAANKIIGLPAREIQNNLWDWDPTALPPADQRNWSGYYMEDIHNSKKYVDDQRQWDAAFMHINQIRDHVSEDTPEPQVFSYVVHPLYYNLYERDQSHFQYGPYGKGLPNPTGEREKNFWEGIRNTIRRTGDSAYDTRNRLKNANVQGIEVFNGFTQKRVHDPSPSDPNPAPYGFEYAEWLWNAFLDEGIYLTGLAGNDAFWSPDYSFDNLKDDPIGSNVVQMPAGVTDPDLNRRHLVNRLKLGAFYASSGVKLADSQWIRADDETNPRIIHLNSGDNTVIWQYTMRAFAQQKNYQTATLISGTMPAGSGEQTFRCGQWEGLKWIRFQALDPNDTRRRAWTQPIRGAFWDTPDP